MSNRVAASTAVASRILAAADKAGITVHGLAVATGIPRDTLRRHLKVAPRFLSLGQIEDIADALGIDYEDLLATTKVAA